MNILSNESRVEAGAEMIPDNGRGDGGAELKGFGDETSKVSSSLSRSGICTSCVSCCAFSIIKLFRLRRLPCAPRPLALRGLPSLPNSPSTPGMGQVKFEVDVDPLASPLLAPSSVLSAPSRSSFISPGALTGLTTPNPSTGLDGVGLSLPLGLELRGIGSIDSIPGDLGATGMPVFEGMKAW